MLASSQQQLGVSRADQHLCGATCPNIPATVGMRSELTPGTGWLVEHFISLSCSHLTTPYAVPMMSPSACSSTTNHMTSPMFSSIFDSSVASAPSGGYNNDSPNCTIGRLHGWPPMRLQAILPSLPSLHLVMISPARLIIHKVRLSNRRTSTSSSDSTWHLRVHIFSCALGMAFSTLALLSDSPTDELTAMAAPLLMHCSSC